MRRLEAAWLPFFRGASPITALRAAQPPAAGSLLRLLRNLADAPRAADAAPGSRMASPVALDL